MDFKEMHALVKKAKPDSEGYVNICDVAKVVYGPRTKKIINQLDYDDSIFVNLRIKGDINDRLQWKINKHDSLELMLRVRDLMLKQQIPTKEDSAV